MLDEKINKKHNYYDQLFLKHIQIPHLNPIPILESIYHQILLQKHFNLV